MNGDSHFSEEEHGLTELFMPVSALMVSALAINLYYLVRDDLEFNRMDDPLIYTMMTLLMLVTKSIIQLIYLAMFSYYGYGFFVLKVYISVTSLTSQVSLCLILLVLAFGQGTLRQQQGLDNANLNVNLGLLIGTVFAHILILILMLADHEERHKWHDY